MTIFEAYNSAKKQLESAGIEDYVFEAKQIIKHITGFTSAQVLSFYNRELTEFQLNNLTAILHQRQIRYPLQYIFGEWDFYRRSFYVGPGVLVPRADTETVVDVCAEYLKDRPSAEILDLCAGSGCIGITLAVEFADSDVSMVEKYDEAIRYAVKNIERNGAGNAEIYKGDIFERYLADRKFDLIVSNPPYVTENEMNTVSPETRFEPETALEAGDGGMEFYKAITENYKNSIKDGGMLCFEAGVNQSKIICGILADAGFHDIKVKKDLCGIERAVSGIK